MEQCSSEVTARFKSSLVYGKTMADLTGGAGIDTYYLSQSFQECHYVEQNALLCAIAQHNFGLFSRPIAVHNLTAEAYLGALKSDRKSTRLNSSHVKISYAVFCLK